MGTQLTKDIPIVTEKSDDDLDGIYKRKVNVLVPTTADEIKIIIEKYTTAVQDGTA